MFDPSSEEKADIVIADLPCSGMGIIGRKPDIKYHMTEESLKALEELQRQILSVVWRYVKPGGTLIYSTCTINKGENEKNASWIRGNLPFEPVDIRGKLPEMGKQPLLLLYRRDRSRSCRGLAHGRNLTAFLSAFLSAGDKKTGLF